jgi:pimeloyl-ACP methyl ester carboxylesterase
VLTSLLDGRVFGERVGSRDADPRVVALHGWARTRADLLPVLDGLDGLALDLPGFGASPPPPRPWGSRDYAELLAPLVAAAPQPLVLVGHSFGGRVAVQLAALQPDRLAGLVLTGTPNLVRLPGAASARPPLGYRLARAAHRRGLLSEARMERLRRSHGSADYRAASGVMRDVLVTVVNEDYAQLLPRIEAPVTLVWAEHDTAAPLAPAQAAAALLPRAQLHVVAGAGHLLGPAVYDALRSAVRAHLAGV